MKLLLFFTLCLTGCALRSPALPETVSLGVLSNPERIRADTMLVQASATWRVKPAPKPYDP